MDLKIDESMINKLKLSFKLDILNTPDNLMGANELRPLKFFILYSENSSFSAAYQTVIAPGMSLKGLSFLFVNHNFNVL